jgi:hypothetical protein
LLLFDIASILLEAMAVTVPQGSDAPENEPFVGKEKKSLYINAETIRVYTFSL